MGPENNVGLGGSWITKCLLPYLSMVTVPHIMVGLERMLDYRGIRLERFHCMYLCCSFVHTYVMCIYSSDTSETSLLLLNNTIYYYTELLT